MYNANAVALSAELRFQNRRCCCACGDENNLEPNEVLVTIGLFTIIKLFRIVNLTVDSRGFCIPEECEDGVSPLNPCEFFDSLDFPMDIFAPPQKTEFLAGISSNIPSKRCGNNVGGITCDSCGCGCSCGNCVSSSGSSCNCGRDCCN